MPKFVNEILLLVTIISAVGLSYIIYSRDKINVSSRLFLLTLFLTVGYLISHGIHFLIIKQTDVTILDQSCHSFLLMILIVLTFFSYYFPDEKQMPLLLKLFIFIPSLILLYGIWTGYFLISSHAHHSHFEAHYSPYYPLFLIWYLILILLNIYFLVKKYKLSDDKNIKGQIFLIFVGLIVTIITASFVGMFLPWILGFYSLVEISPLAFLAGVILFTSLGMSKYNLFPSVAHRFQSFTIAKKSLFTALVVVPVIILFFQIPISRILFGSATEMEWQRYIILNLISGVLVGITMSFVILKIIADPLNKIKDRANLIKNGEFGVQVNISSNDEIGELADTFNNMSKTLQSDSIKLKKNEDRISVLLNSIDNSQNGIVVFDENLKIIEANAKFISNHGNNIDDVGEIDLKKMFSAQLSKTNYEKLIAVINNKEIIQNDFSIESGDVLFTLSTNYSNEDSPTFVLIETDISSVKSLEQQLIEAEKFASLGKMAAVLAHEIKTPLTSIKMNSDILKSVLTLNEEDEKSFGIIQKEVSRLDDLIKDVLQFARQSNLTLEKFKVNDLLVRSYELLAREYKKYNFSILFDMTDIECFGDFDKIYQIMINLISNAFESRNDNGWIKIIPSEDNKYTYLQIIDNGKGIQGDKIKEIFEPFFTMKSRGTGLGLAIARKIINQHNGKLELISSEPMRTEFKLSLPKINGVNNG